MDVTARRILANIKYGNPVDFGTFEEALALVEKFPVLYPKLPEEYRADKRMAVAFCVNNGRYYKEYYDARDSKYVYNRRIASEYDGCAVLEGMVEFGVLLKNVDVLKAIVANDVARFITFSPETYDEAVVLEVLKEDPALIVNVHEYWREHISEEKHKKLVEHLRMKYELLNMPSSNELSFFKCLELISIACPEDERAYLHIFFAEEGYDNHFGKDNLAVMRKVFRRVNPEIRNSLVWRYYYLARFIRSDELDEGLAKDIAKWCAIASEILSDEARIRNHLMPQGLSDEEMKARCKHCQRCSMFMGF